MPKRRQRFARATSEMPKSFASSRIGLDHTNSHRSSRVRVIGAISSSSTSLIADAVRTVTCFCSNAEADQPQRRAPDGRCPFAPLSGPWRLVPYNSGWPNTRDLQRASARQSKFKRLELYRNACYSSKKPRVASPPCLTGAVTDKGQIETQLVDAEREHRVTR